MVDKTGNYAFLLGVVVAVLAALGRLNPGLAVLLLAVLGVVVGLLNVNKKETTKFLVASMTLMLAGGTAGIIAGIGPTAKLLADSLVNITVFVAFAALVVALKTVMTLAED